MKTFWNGQPAKCVKCTLIVRDDSDKFPLFWGKGLVGTRIEAIEVHDGDYVFYLANHDGSGWRKVTNGFGSVGFSHKPVTPVENSVRYL